MFEVKVAPAAEEARAEFDSVLTSTLFVRSPISSRLLQYLCTKYLEGAGEEIKEYQIALEVLNRPATFDPAEDAAVRVEAHRLRKRLREFYETEGSSHRLKVEVPLGHYAIVFQPTTAIEATGEKEQQIQPDSAPSPVPALSVAVNPPERWRIDYRITGIAILAGAMLTLAIAALARHRDPAVTPTASDTSTVAVAPDPNAARLLTPALAAQSSIRIACGRTTSHLDRWGEVWEADRNYEGGTPVAIPRQFIARADDPKIFQAGRTGNFTYKIPLAPGVYELHLSFLEGTYGPGMPAGGGENSRHFEVLANGNPLLSNFDIYSDAGGSNIADVRVFKDISPGPGQALTLTFQSAVGNALVNAIELTPAIPHRLNPIRIIAQDGFYTDSTGAVWKPDRYYSGGQTAFHAVDLRGTNDPDLFARERYGHFDYAIPVDKGTYRLSLYFAEKYFGFGPSPGGHVGTRVFDVTCNGLALLREFDLLKNGDPGQAVVKTFHGLTPNGQGTLLVSFAPVHDYASVYALEVIDESK